MALRISARAWRILRALGELLAPKLECDSSATFGTRPKPATAVAASAVISASCSAVGSTFMCVSARKMAPLCRMTADSANTRVTLGSLGMMGSR